MSAFIDEHRARSGVEPIRRVLGVSASAYYHRATGARDASIKLVERGRPPLPQTTPHSLRRTCISIAQRVKRDHGKAFDALIRHARNEPADT